MDRKCLQHTDVADPTPGAADVVVRVEACALNRLDLVQRNGWFQMPGFTYPHIAGMDAAGTVGEVGSAVASVAVGDRVVIDPSMSGVSDDSKLAGRGDLFGELGILGATADGGYAELCLAPATHVYQVPDDMPIEHVATFPTCWLTAADGLFDVGGLQSDETVLIHAAGSGVSVAAIQLAKHAGATVLATAGTDEKCARAIELGADHVLNNRTGDVSGWARGSPTVQACGWCSTTSAPRCSGRRCSPSACMAGWSTAATPRAHGDDPFARVRLPQRHHHQGIGPLPPRGIRSCMAGRSASNAFTSPSTPSSRWPTQAPRRRSWAATMCSARSCCGPEKR